MICERCGARGAVEKHHMVPRSRGGHDGPMADLCLSCHRGVHDHTVEDWKDWILRLGEEKRDAPIEF